MTKRKRFKRRSPELRREALERVTAALLSKLYGRLAVRIGDCAENRDAVELPLREGTMPINHR